MINNINSNNIASTGPKGLQKRPVKSLSGSSEEADATIQVQYDSLVSRAVDSDVDVQGVEKAKKLILSGQLDTPENIREAATNIVQYGT